MIGCPNWAIFGDGISKIKFSCNDAKPKGKACQASIGLKNQFRSLLMIIANSHANYLSKIKFPAEGEMSKCIV